MLNKPKKGKQAPEQQFAEAYDKYSDAIFRHCYYRIFDRDVAKDYMQEAFCRTWKYIAQGNQIENIRAFLYRTANNIIIDESRKKKMVSLNVIMEKGYAPPVDNREKMAVHFASQEVLEVVKSLEPKYRDVITMKYIDELSPREIASIIKEKENNVYIMLHRGLKKVKKILADQGQRGTA